MSLYDQINTAENSNEASTNEKHLPIITIEDLGDNKHKVKIVAGGGKHPTERDHWFQWVELQWSYVYVDLFSPCNRHPCLLCDSDCQVNKGGWSVKGDSFGHSEEALR